MDVLYISPQASKELTTYCESNLVTDVLQHFAEYGKTITTKEGYDKPSRLWIITDYVSNETIDRRKKLAVMLSFAAIGGVVQIQDKEVIGQTNLICMLKELCYISEDEFDYFVDAFFNFSNGNGVKFK